MADIHVRLRKIISEQGLTTSRFEQIIDVGHNTLATILRKESSVSHIILEKIKRAYPQYSMCWLIAGIEDDNPKLLIEAIRKDMNELLDKRI